MLEILKNPKTVENQRDSDHILEILMILDFIQREDPFCNDPCLAPC